MQQTAPGEAQEAKGLASCPGQLQPSRRADRGPGREGLTPGATGHSQWIAADDTWVRVLPNERVLRRGLLGPAHDPNVTDGSFSGIPGDEFNAQPLLSKSHLL